jgi:hypothetical protein
MVEIQKKGYFPLRRDYLNTHVPSRPGIYILAAQRADGSYEPFYTAETENLFHALHAVLSSSNSPNAEPSLLSDYLHRYQCHFTYYVILQGSLTQEVEKLLAETADPVVRLKIFPMN